MMDWRLAFGALNIVGALLVAGLMIETTPLASVSRARSDPQAMWAMMRRLFYLSMAGGMLGKALWTMEGWLQPTFGDMIFWLMIVIPLGLFLIIRSLRLTDQDKWIGLRDRRERARREHNASLAKTE
jgi:peptidoglycan biosynthesis protein MviN/MurJ (putative lipid II flippase)